MARRSPATVRAAALCLLGLLVGLPSSTWAAAVVRGGAGGTTTTPGGTTATGTVGAAGAGVGVTAGGVTAAAAAPKPDSLLAYLASDKTLSKFLATVVSDGTQVNNFGNPATPLTAFVPDDGAMTTFLKTFTVDNPFVPDAAFFDRHVLVDTVIFGNKFTTGEVISSTFPTKLNMVGTTKTVNGAKVKKEANIGDRIIVYIIDTVLVDPGVDYPATLDDYFTNINTGASTFQTALKASSGLDWTSPNRQGLLIVPSDTATDIEDITQNDAILRSHIFTTRRISVADDFKGTTVYSDSGLPLVLKTTKPVGVTPARYFVNDVECVGGLVSVQEVLLCAMDQLLRFPHVTDKTKETPYAVIAADTKDLSSLKTLIDTLDPTSPLVDTILKADDYIGTLIMPTNKAIADYLKTFDPVLTLADLTTQQVEDLINNHLISGTLLRSPVNFWLAPAAANFATVYGAAIQTSRDKNGQQLVNNKKLDKAAQIGYTMTYKIESVMPWPAA